MKGIILLCFNFQEKFGIAPVAGMSCVVDGTIPPSSGLSSSSALVCCAGLVTMEVNQKSLSKVKYVSLSFQQCCKSVILMFYLIIFSLHCVSLQVALAEICAKCERYIGTEGGGMDQSISFLAERGTVCPVHYMSYCICSSELLITK